MYLYNVTLKVSHGIKEEWIQWMKEVHIPEVLATECFSDAKFFHLFENSDEEGETYSVQFFAESKALYNRYLDKYAPELRNKTASVWGDKVIGFRTVMQIVN